ncbi:MAG: heme exporter protein CcmB [Candidatus Zixiibacteriota bacterium]
MASKAFAVFAKDLRLEWRTKYAMNTILMFGVTTLAVVSFSLGQSGLPAKLLAALFWIVVFFSAMAALAQVFVREEEAGTALILRLSAEPNAVYLGKLFFNLGLLSLMAGIITPLFFIFTDAPTENILPFLLVVFLGVLALCAATTLVAAIISKAAVKGALFAVLSFPILLLPLMLLVIASDTILMGGGVGRILAPLQGLIAYIVVMVTASLMLFRFVWKE